MSAQPQELPRSTLGKNQAIVVGRVREIRRTDNGTFTVVVLPAPDEYTSPQTVEISSKGMIGRPQEDITVKVVIGGYAKKFTRKDGTDGLQVIIQLRAVED